MRQEQQPTDDRVMDVLASMPSENGKPGGTQNTAPREKGATLAGPQVAFSDLAALSHTLVAQLPTESAVPRALAVCARVLPCARTLRLYAARSGGAGGLSLVAQVTRGTEPGAGGDVSTHGVAREVTTLGLGDEADATVLRERGVYRSEGMWALPLEAASGALVGALVVEFEPTAQADESLVVLCADLLAALLDRQRQERSQARMECALEAIPALVLAEDGDETGLTASRRALDIIAELAEPSAVALLAVAPDGTLLAMAPDGDGERIVLDSTRAAEILCAVRGERSTTISSEESADLWNALILLRGMMERSGGVALGRLTLLRVEDGGEDVAAVLAVAQPPGLNAGESWLPAAVAIVAAVEAALRTQRLRREVAAEGQARDEYISLAGHELRSPLTSIKGYAQLLARQSRKTTLPESMVRSVEAIEQQSMRMAEMVGELLDASRIQRGRLELSLGPTDLVQVTLKVLERRRTFHPVHTIELDVDAGSLDGDWDALRVEQIVRDLVDNAARFSPEGGSILISLTREDGNATLRVRDRGIGVAEVERERIFDYLYRAPEAEERNLSSLGLGLYICRYLAERMGGRLILRETRTGEDSGSEFEMSLPLAPQRDSD